MTCEEATGHLVLLAYGELSDEERAELELHQHGCPACSAEAGQMDAFRGLMAVDEMPEISPNLLTASRLRLDEALTEASENSWAMRLRAGLVGVWQHLYAAPALATLLVGAGFMGGTLLTRYQVAHAPRPADPVVMSHAADSKILGVNGIEQMSDPDVVQVHYNVVTPTTFQGRIDEPQVRELLMMAAQKSADNDVRAQSVAYLARECRAGLKCAEGDTEAATVRDALLVTLRYDKSPAVRLKALDALEPYLGEDHKVRDAVLESLMRDGSADVRKRAIGVLEPVEGDSTVRQVLHTVSTRDENPYIRNASMQVLGDVDGIQ